MSNTIQQPTSAAEQEAPDRFVTACLTLATRAVEEQDPHSYKRSPWTFALMEVLEMDLLHREVCSCWGEGLREAQRLAEQEAERLIEWVRQHPDELGRPPLRPVVWPV